MATCQRVRTQGPVTPSGAYRVYPEKYAGRNIRGVDTDGVSAILDRSWDMVADHLCVDPLCCCEAAANGVRTELASHHFQRSAEDG